MSGARTVDGVVARASRARTEPARPGAAVLRGLGCSAPPQRHAQAEMADMLVEAWRLRGSAAARFRRLSEATGIRWRHTAGRLDEVVGCTTHRRMEMYEAAAPRLAERAARAALDAAGLTPDAVTDLIVVSCTGFSAPGVDIAVAGSLGLRPEVRRTIVGFMGCYGAIVGLRTARAACAAEPTAIALVVCVELCSMHVRADADLQNQVASALFADGAAAAVVTGSSAAAGPARRIGRLTAPRSALLREAEDQMSWRITDHGFRMTLSRDVPAVLRRSAKRFLETDLAPDDTLALHPGGPEIIDAIDGAMGMNGGRGLDASRAVLRRYGNMSSATVLFVLDELIRRDHPLPATLLAFGPGLCMESIRLEA